MPAYSKKDQVKPKIKKKKPKNLLTPLENKLDKLWSLKVKELAGYACEYCGKDTTLNSHHIYSRSKKSVRWCLLNGVCLCVSHHTFSSTFSAHKTPAEFIDWIELNRGVTWLIGLKTEANKISDKITVEYLQDLIDAYGSPKKKVHSED